MLSFSRRGWAFELKRRGAVVHYKRFFSYYSLPIYHRFDALHLCHVAFDQKKIHLAEEMQAISGLPLTDDATSESSIRVVQRPLSAGLQTP
jgi:hypothetical protein